jgi:adenylyltransferase/sulfurtransferase
MSTDRYSRQTLFFPNGEADQQRLTRSRAVLVGCGALGTVLAGLLVRAGLGHLRIVDRDFIELSNLQRQGLFDEDDVCQGLPKAVAAARKLGRANSAVTVEPLTADFSADNAERLLRDADLVLDGTDNFEARYLINDVCVMLDKRWIYSAAVGSYGVTMNVLPGRTACLRCVFPVTPTAGAVETCDTSGVLGPIASIVASFASAEAIKLLIGAEERLRPGLLWIDVWHNSLQSTPLAGPVADCPTCQQRRFEFLDSAAGRSATLCGRAAVQVRPSRPQQLRFDELGPRLRAVGEVSWNEFLLRLSLAGAELTLFPDGRAIVKGTDDPAAARALYARYVGY